ncbi:JAB domain-containing protein [Modicisalibacter xianhensis]|uniref:DNA repair protein RadC n=1 Tax=Modicisalibacter xianhensis TaxID=442341 RepID=A0A1I3EQM3_9GAMM|nr:JAB domain-containing protein [Halomonas xianhensis]SFI01222.1 DNA repair protein RadC [Halomonas xianhensis]
MKPSNQMDMFAAGTTAAAVAEPAKLYSLPGKGAVETTEQRREREDAVISEALNIIETRLMGQFEGDGALLTAPWIVADYLKLKYSELPYEVFSVTWLNSRHRVIQHEELFRGTLAQAPVFPREVARRALELNAACVVLSHNHPGQDPTESDADRKITKRLEEVLGMIDVRVLDHIIVGGTEHVSFAEKGLI